MVFEQNTNMENWGNYIDRGKQNSWRETCPSDTVFIESLYGLAWHWTQASALEDRTLNAWGMACIACTYVSKVSQCCWFRS